MLLPQQAIMPNPIQAQDINTTPEVPQATPQVAPQAPAQETEQPKPKPIKKSKLKSNLLELVHQEVAQESRAEVKVIELTEAVVADLFQKFEKHLGETLQRNTAAQQIKLARTTFEPPNKITIWCVSEINKVMVGPQKDLFFDFIKEETKQVDIQIGIEIDANAIIEVPQEAKRKTKEEIFEEMASINPALLSMKNKLNLKLE